MSSILILNGDVVETQEFPPENFASTFFGNVTVEHVTKVAESLMVKSFGIEQDGDGVRFTSSRHELADVDAKIREIRESQRMK